MHRKDSQMVVRNGKKVVGIYDAGSATFRKEAYRSTHDGKKSHYMFKLKAWGIQENVIQILEGLKCKTIEVHIRDEKKVLSIPFTLALRTATKGNFGAGPQRFIPEEMFEEVKVEPVTAFDQGPMQ